MDLISVSHATIKHLEEKNGAVLKEVEKRGKVTIKINKDKNIELEGEGGEVWIASQVLKALDFGFLPQQAFKLFNDNYFLEIIDLEIILPNPKAIERYKGRIIGEGGRAKMTLQELSGAFLAIIGNKVAIIGEFDDLQLAKEGVLRLLEGSPHTSVYAFMERKNRERKYALK
ncbi:MAG: KH domain-containing protein [Candidatus Micrarchaeota archaeon]